MFFFLQNKMIYHIQTTICAGIQTQIRTVLSQLHDANAMPLVVIEIEVTRFSCPFSDPLNSTHLKIN